MQDGNIRGNWVKDTWKLYYSDSLSISLNYVQNKKIYKQFFVNSKMVFKYGEEQISVMKVKVRISAVFLLKWPDNVPEV